MFRYIAHVDIAEKMALSKTSLLSNGSVNLACYEFEVGVEKRLCAGILIKPTNYGLPVDTAIVRNLLQPIKWTGL